MTPVESIRALRAVRLLTAIRLENPELYLVIHRWAKGEEKRLGNNDMYHRFSPYNFDGAHWYEAAVRFEELKAELVRAEAVSERDHRHSDFEVCDICAKAHELQRFYSRFAEHFGPIWAKKCLELTGQSRKAAVYAT